VLIEEIRVDDTAEGQGDAPAIAGLRLG